MNGVLREATIDVGAIADNVRHLRRLTASEIIAVVKADGYGHGAARSAAAALEGGATRLGVADIGEALALRRHGIDAPVLAWLHAPGTNFGEAAAAGIELGISSLDQLLAAAAAASADRPVGVHLKLETGLSRNGIAPADWRTVFAEAARLERIGKLRVIGLFSHLSNASEDDDRAALVRFDEGVGAAVVLRITSYNVCYTKLSSATDEASACERDVTAGLGPDRRVSKRCQGAVNAASRIWRGLRWPQLSAFAFGFAPASTGGRPIGRCRMTSIASVPASTLGAVRQTYARTDSFPHMTKAYTEVSQVVKESGLLRRARLFYLFVGIALALAFGGVVTGFILLGDTWYQLLMAGALGLILTQAAFLAHEAAHKQILATGPANERLGRILAAGVVGISLSWWNAKHSRHHANPNAVGKDPDIEVDTIRFLEEDAAKVTGPMRFITERQGWLFFPLLTLEGLNLHFLGLKHLFSRGKVKGRWLELSLIAVHFAVLFGAVFWVLPLGMAFAFIGVQMAVFGVYMGASFAPNHKGMPIVAHDAKLDFFTKQVRTSRNISGGWWATTLMGGLNYQVEHHLFPNMPRPHLAKAREIVIEHCKTLNVPYTETTLLQSYGIVIAYLNRVGLAARDPFDCPAAGQLRQV